MITITTDGTTLEIQAGGHVYCSNPDAFFDWEGITPEQQETVGRIQHQFTKLIAELSALIQETQMHNV